LDQKPENALFAEDGTIKLSDFGSTVRIGTRTKRFGTPGYIPPEAIATWLEKEGEGDGRITALPSADVWALGCMLADIFGSPLTTYFRKNFKFGLIPYEDVNFEAAKDHALPKWREEGSMDELISDCLSVDAESRPSIRNIATRFMQISKAKVQRRADGSFDLIQE
jgi:serine/threonine protein kinase